MSLSAKAGSAIAPRIPLNRSADNFLFMSFMSDLDFSVSDTVSESPGSPKVRRKNDSPRDTLKKPLIVTPAKAGAQDVHRFRSGTALALNALQCGPTRASAASNDCFFSILFGTNEGSGQADQAQVVVQMHHMRFGILGMIEFAIGEVWLQFPLMPGKALEGRLQALQRLSLAGRFGQR